MSFALIVAAEKVSLRSVSSFPTLEDLYVRVKSQHSSSAPEPPIPPKDKIRICWDITGGDYFATVGSVRADMEESCKKLKKKKYRHIFKQIYSESTLDPDQPGCLVNLRKKYDYVNAYTSKKLAFDNERYIDFNMEEEVFLCVTKKFAHDDVFDAWCVSREYRTDMGEHDGDEHIAGRFIFKCPANELKLIALAEEPSWATISSRTETERHYIETRKQHSPVQKAELDQDPLCRLIERDREHSRLCTSVFASSIFRGYIKYQPIDSLEEYRCRYRKITFQTYHPEQERVEYQEWMSVCKGRDTRFRNDVYFLISRAYNSNHVFVHKYHTGKNGTEICLQTLHDNINIIDTGNRIQNGVPMAQLRGREQSNIREGSAGASRDAELVSSSRQRAMRMAEKRPINDEWEDGTGHSIIRESSQQADQFTVSIPQAEQQESHSSRFQGSSDRRDRTGGIVMGSARSVPHQSAPAPGQQYITRVSRTQDNTRASVAQQQANYSTSQDDTLENIPASHRVRDNMMVSQSQRPVTRVPGDQEQEMRSRGLMGISKAQQRDVSNIRGSRT